MDELWQKATRDPRNLRTLCRRCHDMAHRSGAAERAMADEHQARLEVWG